MNRREALAALTALPEATRLSVARPELTDVILVEVDRPAKWFHTDLAQTLLSQVQKVWPNHRIVLCPSDMRIRFVKDDAGHS